MKKAKETAKKQEQPATSQPNAPTSDSKTQKIEAVQEEQEQPQEQPQDEQPLQFLTGKVQIIISATESHEQGTTEKPHYLITREGVVRNMLPLIESAELEGNISLPLAIAIQLEGGGKLYKHLDGYYYHNAEGEPVGDAVRVPYEYCQKSPYRQHLHYEPFYPKQVEALKLLIQGLQNLVKDRFLYLNTLGEYDPRAKPTMPIVAFTSTYIPTRSDPHPQVDLLRTIKQTLQG